MTISSSSDGHLVVDGVLDLWGNRPAESTILTPAALQPDGRYHVARGPQPATLLTTPRSWLLVAILPMLLSTSCPEEVYDPRTERFTAIGP